MIQIQTTKTAALCFRLSRSHLAAILRTKVKDIYSSFQDVDTALIKLYCKEAPSNLVTFLTSNDLICDFEDCLSVLKNFPRHHASALLLLKMNRFDEAFGIWTQLMTGTLTDELFPGIDCFIENLVM